MHLNAHYRATLVDPRVAGDEVAAVHAPTDPSRDSPLFTPDSGQAWMRLDVSRSCDLSGGGGLTLAGVGTLSASRSWRRRERGVSPRAGRAPPGLFVCSAGGAAKPPLRLLLWPRGGGEASTAAASQPEPPF